MVRRLVFAAPGDLTTPTGGYAYDRRVIAGLRSLGWRIEVLDLGDGFPRPSAEARATAQRRLAALPADLPIVIDGLAFGVLPDVATALRATRRLIALVHHPLAEESGLSPEEVGALRMSERQALACARRVIVTSPFTERLVVSDYGVPAEQVRIVRPGSDRVAPARADAEAPLTMLAVGAVTPRKGYDVLAAACARLLDLSWRLVIAGDLGRDADSTTRLKADIARFNLGDRIRLAGAVAAERLEALYASADLFVSASRFEGYGMAIAEAIAHGLPVVGTTAGAIPQTAPAGASLLAPPNDAGALAAALRRLIEDSAARRRLAAAARPAPAALPTWEHSAALFAQAIETAP